jgi:hypothetical protein
MLNMTGEKGGNQNIRQKIRDMIYDKFYALERSINSLSRTKNLSDDEITFLEATKGYRAALKKLHEKNNS